eukprot:5552063-Amphidinium_carterae.1
MNVNNSECDGCEDVQYEDVISKACAELMHALQSWSLPLATTRTNIFEEDGGRVRGAHFGLQLARGKGISANDTHH